MPVYQLVSGLAFSHAYYGAVRHEITVGFVSMMIMGVAARVAPTLRGIHPGTLNSLTGPFVLINVGCALRVSLQTLTDRHPFSFAVVGVSGLLELAALVWWGTGLLRILHGSPGSGPGVSRPVVLRPVRSGAGPGPRAPSAGRARDSRPGPAPAGTADRVCPEVRAGAPGSVPAHRPADPGRPAGAEERPGLLRG
ncbi:hypothetical protein DMH02_011460 [Streptomyces sp. WAC 00631]|uniref:hypothetical protein n=1 Tax=Streptomyces sp. WAC 00631 TaxID=2203201 RepID=UPI00163D2213|nr:hypothetical protein [Streptomyces sp. WAC 00631]MCC5033825.1 hypothetical protein [Streptomyces sp. WAC 00631]